MKMKIETGEEVEWLSRLLTTTSQIEDGSKSAVTVSDCHDIAVSRTKRWLS